MVICAVFGCGNRSGRDKGIKFFRLPSVLTNQGRETECLSEKRRDTWLVRINRKDILLEQYYNTRVCSNHFVSGAPSKLYDNNNPDWAPSLKLGYESIDKTCIESRTERYERGMKRRRMMLQEYAENECTQPTLDMNDNGEPEDSVQNGNSITIQTDLSYVTIDEEMIKLRYEIDELRKENEKLKQSIRDSTSLLEERTVNEGYFEDNDKKVLYYTGLGTWALLMTLFMYVKPHLQNSGKFSLSPFQQLIVTLMRLRLNLPIQDLGYRFQVHTSTVSRIFSRVVDVLFVKLKPLIRWPDRDALSMTMPMAFRKHYPRCVVIIDCFEVFLDRPTNLLARAQTFSAYKHHNTVKYLIGITPQGTVSFISEGWGGRTSDKYLTEHSSLLNNLLPGDTILADRGFDIKDTVGLYCSKLEIPAFTKGKKQLDPISVEETRNIANVRIHIERVIGNVRKKYSILSATQPIDFVISENNAETTLDKIVHVACALINMCDSVVPFD